jgi:hypothetical protein
MKKIYLFEALNYYIGNNLCEELKNKAVELELVDPIDENMSIEVYRQDDGTLNYRWVENELDSFNNEN